MASISISFPDAAAQRVLDAVCAARGYDAATNGTKAQFAKLVLARMIKEIVLQQEGRVTIDDSLTTLRANVEGIGIS